MAHNLISVRFVGTSPLCMHNGQLANPFNPYAQQIQALNKEKKRKGQDPLGVMREMADVEWEGGLYYDPAVGPYLPEAMVRACIQEGAKLTRGGRTVTRSVLVRPTKIPLLYAGPRTVDLLKPLPAFRDQRMVRVQTSGVLRTRPIFHEWSIEFDVHYNPEGIDAMDLAKYLLDAGQFEGLAEGRGKLGFGRFEAFVKEKNKWLPAEAILSAPKAAA